MRPPIIFMGMHRSGTSMLGRLLEGLGLFTGAKQDANSEAFFFQRLNKWLMAQCGARWDMPGALRYLLENEELMAWIDDYLRCLLNSTQVIEFIGLRRYVAMSRNSRLQVPWGWKDPRNTFTLPIWLRIFPEAKVIYTERHGVDVAQSLRVRSRSEFANATRKYQRYRPFVSLRPKREGFVESPRCSTLEGGFSLWQEYVNQAKDIMHQLPRRRLLKLRYENLLEDPFTQLRTSAEFCGLNVSDKMIESRAAGIDASRAYAYRNDPELCELSLKHQIALADRDYK